MGDLEPGIRPLVKGQSQKDVEEVPKMHATMAWTIVCKGPGDDERSDET